MPHDFELGNSPLDFDRDEMTALFERGRRGARSGDAWRLQPPPAEPFGLLQILDPSTLCFTRNAFPAVPRRPPRWMRSYEALDERTELALCACEAGTYYHAVGTDIGQRLQPFNVSVRLVPTKGSTENLRRLRAGSCDAALAQNDAYFMELVDESISADELDVIRPKYVFDEYVFLICPRESGVRRVADLRERPRSHRLLIGQPGSGSVV